MKSQALQTTSEIQIQKSNLEISLIIACERTSTGLLIYENMINDIISEFPKVSNEDFTTAIRNGSLGKYGKTFKLSTQEVCIWIREYLKEKNRKTLVL